MQKLPRQTPAALREKGSGEEELLSEKLPPPQNLPPANLFRREREGGRFSIRKAPSLAKKNFIKGIDKMGDKD